MVVAGANDGMLHIFDGGVWDRDRGATDETYNEIHDLGTGIELAAWIPQAVMDKMYYITAGGSLTHQEPQYLVDGPTAKGDVRIDADGDGDKEWRTIILSTMRRGGRGVLALDVTQPDPTDGDPDYTPTVSQFAGCRVGTTNGCDGFEWPRPMWEFSDQTDADSNCPGGLSGDDCAPYWDLGWTWSKPAIARIATYNGSVPAEPDDTYVAFFGGGWDETETDATGRHFYGIDIETGAVVVKEVIGVDLPGGVTALDSDIDGFHDRIYFADTNGGIWRLAYGSPTDSGQTGPAAGTLTKIYDFSADFVDRQEFFMRPVPVPVLFDGNGYTWALGIGSGDRANLDREDSGIDHFYFVIDGGDGVTRDASVLTAVSFADLDGNFTCPSTTLDPPNGKYGWYLSLRDTEKVMFDCTVIDGYVLFPTFDPSTDTATHNVPDQCDGSGGGDGDPIELDVVCRASGIGRTYKLWYECGLGDYSEHNDIITGSEDYSIGGDTFVTFTGSVDGPGQTETFPLVREHSVTNWRQE
jgi:Tfp pilus tip-associated adhesin PilY1